MTLPAFTPSIAPDVEAVIQSKLSALEAEHDVRVLFAIESGSRAWGFPSPDSDYDVRFVYARPPDWYLSIEPGRDVIELPIEGDWDINGWDIRKALGLLIKPNPVLLEWLSSPIRYRWNDAICDCLIQFADKTTFGESCLHHYRNLAVKQWDKHVGENPDVSLKKYFYILRPALAIAWIRQNPAVQPPMNLQALVGGLPLNADLVGHIKELLILKSATKEIGKGARIPMIDAFIHDQIAWAGVVAKEERRPDLMAEGDALLREIVNPSSRWKARSKYANDLRSVLDRPGMYFGENDLSEAIGFVCGLGLGAPDNVMSDFQEWFTSRFFDKPMAQHWTYLVRGIPECSAATGSENVAAFLAIVRQYLDEFEQ